jgi:hypothetical protein
MIHWGRIAASLVIALAIVDARAAPPAGASVRFPQTIRSIQNFSAAAWSGSHLFIASDETTEVLVLEAVPQDRTGGWSFRSTTPPIRLPVSGNDEIDIEAIAADGKHIYVAGSHSLARGKLSASRTAAKNRERFSQIKREENRERIFRFEFDAGTGVVSKVARISLRRLLERDPILRRFTEIPGKENGIDIEGMSVVDGTLYLGFRSPVLRQGLVPILKMRFSAPNSGQLLLVDLGGRGIRGMTPVGDGFFLLAGPAAKGGGSYVLFHWTGADGLPGRDRPVPATVLLGSIEAPKGSRAEALTVLRSEGSCHDLLIVFDGIAGGDPQVERVCLPDPA